MREIINIGSQVLMFLYEGYLLQYFLGSFLESRFPWKKRSGLLVAFTFGMLTYGMDFILPSDYGSIRIFGKKLMTLVLLFLITFCFYKAKEVIIVYLIVTFMAVSDICFFIAYMIMQTGPHLTDFWVNLSAEGYFESVDVFMNTVEFTLTVVMFVMYVVFIALTYFFLKKIIENFREKEYAIRKKELFFLLTPGLVGLLLCTLLRLIMFTVEGEMPKLIYDQYPPLIWLVPAIMLLSLMSILYVVKLFQDMIDLNRERSSRMILEKQIDSMQEHVKEVERIYSGVRSMKHDMKNTLSVVMQLAEKGGEAEKKELQAYLTEVNQSFDSLEIQFQTGNHVVDTLLNMKYHEIIRIIPDLQMDADRLIFPENLDIHSYDMGVILGNALDNAIEACGRLKASDAHADTFIRLSSFVKGKMFFIEVENSFDGKVIRKKQSEFPITDKADKKAHGMGLMNIRNTAEKYHGAVDWKAENKVFTLTVMMKNERRHEDEFGNNKFNEQL